MSGGAGGGSRRVGIPECVGRVCGVLASLIHRRNFGRCLAGLAAATVGSLVRGLRALAERDGVGLYARHNLDVSVGDLISGIRYCVSLRHVSEGRVLRACSSEDEGLVVLSVRSGWDLLLEALALPEGSEVLVSAITHPDMGRILEFHGLRALPIDLDSSTLAPREELLSAALTSRTRAVLVAHLFGGRTDLSGISAFAREHSLLLIEDNAQSFRGPDRMGDVRADVSMYSFGPLKTSTALGGGILRVRNPALLDAMRTLNSGRPVQHRREFLSRLVRVLSLKFLTRPVPYRVVSLTCALLGRDLDDLAGSAVRGFRTGSGEDLIRNIRRRPCSPLLALLLRRILYFDETQLSRRALAGERLMTLLPHGLEHPGACSEDRTHWLFPVVAPEPERLVAALRGRGIDASHVASSIAVVHPPADRPELAPEAAARVMAGIVFLPACPNMPHAVLERLVWTLRDVSRGSRW